MAMLFFSCNIQKRNRVTTQNYLLLHPAYLDSICSAKVKDSVFFRVDSTHHALNVNYAAALDTLQQKYEALYEQLITLEGQNTDNQELVQKLKQQASDYLNAIDRLKSNYRPCGKDTVYNTRIIYQENTAKLNVKQRQLDSVNFLLQKISADRDQQKENYSSEHNKYRTLWFWLIGVSLALIISIVLRFISISI